ncbi:MAG: SWIM zinc finger family protein [Opitutaceae bacterium]|jgi:uncharacterized Zn finger protein
MFRSYYGFHPYVPVAVRRRNAEKEAAGLQKKGTTIEPVRPEGKIIARSFWGKAWCTNLESYSDYANRLPRGRTYLRNGSVVHLSIKKGRIEALVSGSSLYKVAIGIKPFPAEKWKVLCQQCAGEIGSLVDLLQGKLSDRVMSIITRHETGLFPSPSEIDLDCSCPDWADMCKHVAAVLYGVGTRLDAKPELLFTLRSVNQNDLIAHAASATQFIGSAAGTPGEAELDESEVSALFGIEIDQASASAPPQKPVIAKRSRAADPQPATPVKKRSTVVKKQKPKAAKKKVKSKKKARGVRGR